MKMKTIEDIHAKLVTLPEGTNGILFLKESVFSPREIETLIKFRPDKRIQELEKAIKERKEEEK